MVDTLSFDGSLRVSCFAETDSNSSDACDDGMVRIAVIASAESSKPTDSAFSIPAVATRAAAAISSSAAVNSLLAGGGGGFGSVGKS